MSTAQCLLLSVVCLLVIFSPAKGCGSSCCLGHPLVVDSLVYGVGVVEATNLTGDLFKLASLNSSTFNVFYRRSITSLGLILTNITTVLNNGVTCLGLSTLSYTLDTHNTGTGKADLLYYSSAGGSFVFPNAVTCAGLGSQASPTTLGWPRCKGGYLNPENNQTTTIDQLYHCNVIEITNVLIPPALSSPPLTFQYRITPVPEEVGAGIWKCIESGNSFGLGCAGSYGPGPADLVFVSDDF